MEFNDELARSGADRVWGEYDKYGYRIFSYRHTAVPAGLVEETGELGEELVYTAGNSPWESTAVLRGEGLRDALPLAQIAAHCERTTRETAVDEGLAYGGVVEVNEDDEDDADDYGND